MAALRRQFYEIEVGEFVQIGGSRVTLAHKTGRRARLMVESDQPTQGPKERAPNFQRASTTPEQPSGPASLKPPTPGD